MPRLESSCEWANNISSTPEWFRTTQWGVVFSAGEMNSVDAPGAREHFCRTYWRPIYGYVRRQGYGSEDAQDLTQGFFAKLLEKNFWARADREKGRFRSFLLTALRQYVADERDRARTAKRGGGLPLISLEELALEEKIIGALDPSVSGELDFDQRWASAVLDQARKRLLQECITSGKAELYDRLNLLGDRAEKPLSYAVLAPILGMTVSGIKSAVLRIRERYGELVREEISKTVANAEDVNGEIGYLLSIIAA
jgi:DNA-directed RNA polymerase specialized sigma24 family protein